MTVATDANTGTVISVSDAAPFTNGFGIFSGDLIIVGTNSYVTITAVDITLNQLTVSNSISWIIGDSIQMNYLGSAPDIGAFEYDETAPTATPTPISYNNVFNTGSEEPPTDWRALVDEYDPEMVNSWSTTFTSVSDQGALSFTSNGGVNYDMVVWDYIPGHSWPVTQTVKFDYIGITGDTWKNFSFLAMVDVNYKRIIVNIDDGIGFAYDEYTDFHSGISSGIESFHQNFAFDSTNNSFWFVISPIGNNQVMIYAYHNRILRSIWTSNNSYSGGSIGFSLFGGNGIEKTLIIDNLEDTQELSYLASSNNGRPRPLRFKFPWSMENRSFHR